MKKNRLIAALGILGVSLAIGLSSTSAHADDTDLHKTSTGTFSVNTGDLKLESVPSFDFGTTNLKDLVSGTTLKNQSTTNNTLSVSDYRGASNDKWNLTAALGNFTNQTGSGSVTGTIEFKTNSSAAGTIDSSASNVWNYTDADTKGASTASATVDNNTTSLTAENYSNVDGGEYSANVTWTLSDTSAN
ncbi:WxL domain-containing protein [Pediococcus ethanolidurans]|uniref:WxL domain-containing protein n=1 Tax=Pediococcus ethanolidurans TaxID=319653 RepID=UPI001C1E9B93|nr:WxL domain-containing protein [Pediococcus ethanolidurans]MBU7554781.1 WxL domain-containing protein [Pediococcus ethanolidurans]MBU7562889.1 WxL domain-containing protein [Pediococcus ethanolidurans]MCT4398780.1 hypothetical protein [Pediococcus ethanolidurans]MCV3315303.1 WxL domain-containing protein [Pediococcus ethanolidurans]MCV3321243.1 WxL domain-containing protein [Pediococcus ethanolidurans]